MGMMKEFKEFAMRGNVIDLAVGVVIGAAFGAIVTSLVADVVMPVIGLLTSGLDFKDSALVLKAAATGPDGKPVPAVLLSYGKFINTLINFAIIAFVIFMVVKGINSLKKKEAEAPAAPAAPTTDQQLLMEIRDLLKSRAP